MLFRSHIIGSIYVVVLCRDLDPMWRTAVSNSASCVTAGALEVRMKILAGARTLNLCHSSLLSPQSIRSTAEALVSISGVLVVSAGWVF